MIVSRIRARNWKNFTEAEASLGYRVFLIGPNASGKSNFLDILRFLREVATRGLGEAVKTRSGVSALRSLAARQYSDIDLEIDLADDSGKVCWTYQLTFSQDSTRQPMIRSEIVHGRSGEKLLERPDELDKQDALRLTQTALQQVNANREFREIADFLTTISYQHIVPQAIRDPKGFTGTGSAVQNDPYGRDFLLRVYRTMQRTRDARLRNINTALRVAVPSLQELSIDMDDHGVPHLRGRYQHWRHKGAYQSEAQFSDGTLRLLGLLWTLFEGTGPILLEEPELSLHSEVVRHLPAVFEKVQRLRKTRRQIIMSTHSREMLADKGIAAEEVLWIDVTKDGSVLQQPNEADKRLIKSGMSPADVLLPRSSPANMEQLVLSIE